MARVGKRRAEEARVVFPRGLDERFDVAMMLESFCHVDRPERALRILRRLAPRLVLLDHVSPGDSYVDTRWRMRFSSHEAFRALEGHHAAERRHMMMLIA